MNRFGFGVRVIAEYSYFVLSDVYNYCTAQNIFSGRMSVRQTVDQLK